MSCVNVLDNDFTLVSPPTFAQEFACATKASNHNAAALARITFNPDGTWAIFRNAGAAASGSWHVGAPAVAFEIRFIGNVQEVTFTSGTVDCDTPAYQETNTPVDSGWLPLSVAQMMEVAAYAVSNVICDSQEMIATFTFSIQIRQISKPTNTVTGAGSICADATAF